MVGRRLYVVAGLFWLALTAILLTACDSPAPAEPRLPDCLPDSIVALMRKSIWAPTLVEVPCARR